MNSQAGVIEFSGLPAGSEIVANFDGTTYSGSNILLADGEYTQVFEFVEFPLYLRYSVLDSKFGLEIMGGVNTAIVADNNVYFERSGTARNIGKTKDISRVNFSGTVGLGVNYALGKNFSLSVEPRFNYYLNSINQNPDVNFRPYRIGVYTGLYYEF
jgi:opacity protein-like surface antigen